MAVKTILYTCNYTSNVYTKTKKWHSGFLRARTNHGSVSLSLYELDQYSNSRGKLVDKMDIFNSQSDSLSGQEFSTPRNIIYVMDLIENNGTKTPVTASPRPKPRASLKKLKPFAIPGTLSKDWQSKLDSKLSIANNTPLLKITNTDSDRESLPRRLSDASTDSEPPTQKRHNDPDPSDSPPKAKLFKADKVTFADQPNSPTSPLNINDILKNVESMLE